MAKDFDRAIDELVDKNAIRELLARYCRGVDRADVDLISSTYTADAWDDHGTFRGLGTTFATLPRRSEDTNRIVHHMLGQSLIDIDGDDARGETYFVCHVILEAEGGSQPMKLMIGRYLDRFRREGGEWKVWIRHVVLDWQGIIADAAGAVAKLRALEAPASGQDYTQGQRYPKDPVYRFDDVVRHGAAARVEGRVTTPGSKT